MVLKIYETDNAFNNISDAIKYTEETELKYDVILYSINSKKLSNMVHSFYDYLSKYNSDKPLNEQILPSYPSYYRGIKGCLGVECADIMVGTYEKRHDCIPLFSEWYTNVLHAEKEEIDMRPSKKATNSLFTLFTMLAENERKKREC